MRRNMSTYAYTLLTRAKSSGDVIADIGNEHFMQKQNDLFGKFLLFRSFIDIFHHAREIFRLKELALGDISIKIDLEKNFLRLL